MNAATTELLLQAFANELQLNEKLTLTQKLDLLTDLENAIYATIQKVGA